MPKPFAIVLLPAGPGHEDEYTLAIEPACTAAGAYVERVSDALDDDSILQRIHNQLAKRTWSSRR